MKLSEKDYDALYYLLTMHGGSALISAFEDKDSMDVLDSWSPGLNRFKKLDKCGLVIITEEDPIDLDDGSEPFQFTPMIDLTDLGRDIASKPFTKQ